MYKDGNNINIDELVNIPTTDADGLEVMVYIQPGDLTSFLSAIKSQLVFFENLYFSGDRHWSSSVFDAAKEFNNLKIKRYTHFSVSSSFNDDKTTLCLGKIRYPLNSSALPNTKFKFSENYPISVNFEIGDLEVTPNREQILYTKHNIKKIEEKLDLVQEELDQIIEKEINKDYTDFFTYIEVLKHSTKTIVLLTTDDNAVTFSHKITPQDISYKGTRYDKNLIALYNFITQDISFPESFINFKVDNGKLVSKFSYVYLDKSISTFNSFRLSIPTKLYIGKLSDYNSITKDYFRQELLNNTYFVQDWSIRKLIKYILKAIKLHISRDALYTKVLWDKEQIKLILKILTEQFSTVKHFKDQDVPISFVANRKLALKQAKLAGISSINWKEEVNLFILRRSERTTYGEISVATTSKRISLQTLKDTWNKFPVIYSEKGDKFLKELFWIFLNIPNQSYNQYKFIEIAPTKLGILKQFPNFIPIEKFMNVEYKKIRALATAILIQEKIPYLKELSYMSKHIGEISKKAEIAIEKLNIYVIKNSLRDSGYYYQPIKVEILDDIKKICAEHKYYDEEILGFMNEHLSLIEHLKFLTLFPTGLREELINFSTDYILTKKLFAPDLTAVKRLRTETIFNKKD